MYVRYLETLAHEHEGGFMLDDYRRGTVEETGASYWAATRMTMVPEMPSSPSSIRTNCAPRPRKP